MLKTHLSALLALIMMFLAVAATPAAGLCEASAENADRWEKFRYDMTFDMPSADAASPLKGLEELMDLLRLQGTFVLSEDGSFDLNCRVSLKGDAGIEFTLCGLEDLWKLTSPIWKAEEPIMISLMAVLEFGLKMQAHLRLPVQYVGLAYPWISYDAFGNTWRDLWETMHQTEGDRVVSRDDIVELGARFENYLVEDRALRMWFIVMSTINDAGGHLQDVYRGFHAWVDEHVQDQIEIKTTSDGERWMLGDTELYAYQDNAAGKAIRVYLPDFVDGTDASFTYQLTMQEDETYNVEFRFLLGEGDACLLDLSYAADHVPDVWPAKRDWSAQLDAKGPLLSGVAWPARNEKGELTGGALTDQLHLSLNGTPDEVSVADEQGELLKMLISASPYEPEQMPSYNYYTLYGFNIFSLNDDTLPDLHEAIDKDEVKKLFPLIFDMPTSTTVELMDILQGSGLLDEFAYASYTGDYEEEEYDEEEEEWDEDWEEDWEDEESWEDEEEDWEE
ncbi:MAG: hypothetical protein IJ083_06370 [Clostridia bacterium]|nr:hypothetical protein [Clostridia bacterium]